MCVLVCVCVCSVEGGELFDRIIDESFNLTELDTVLFIRQISEGLQYMHRMYILHLDLKVHPHLCSHIPANLRLADDLFSQLQNVPVLNKMLKQ